MKLEKKIELACKGVTNAKTITEYVAKLREYNKLQNRYMKHHYNPYEIKRDDKGGLRQYD